MGRNDRRHDDQLRKLDDELHFLREQNRQLREAAASFGDPAERVRGRSEPERREHAADRRTTYRQMRDRRQR